MEGSAPSYFLTLSGGGTLFDVRVELARWELVRSRA